MKFPVNAEVVFLVLQRSSLLFKSCDGNPRRG